MISNCLFHALWYGGLTRIRTLRNRSGRVHFYWVDKDGLAHEFYAKGASRRSYWRNSLYRGTSERVPSLDEVQTGDAATSWRYAKWKI